MSHPVRPQVTFALVLASASLAHARPAAPVAPPLAAGTSEVAPVEMTPADPPVPPAVIVATPARAFDPETLNALIDERVTARLADRKETAGWKDGFFVQTVDAKTRETQTLFAERGLPTLLAPNRDLGVQVHGDLAKGAFAYQVGVFNGVADGSSGDGDVSDDKEGAARVFVKPFVASGGALKELGVGAAVTYGEKIGTVAASDLAALRTQGGTTFFAYRTGTTLMDTVVADGRHWRATGQSSYYAGPVGLLGEYVRSVQRVVLDGTHKRVVTDAWQAVVQYVLTDDDATCEGPKRQSARDECRRARSDGVLTS